MGSEETNPIVNQNLFIGANSSNISSVVEHASPHIVIPFRNIFISLLVLVIPLLIGVGVRRCWPKIADVAQKVSKLKLINKL